MAEEAKLQFLVKQIQNLSLDSVIQALRVRQETTNEELTQTQAANYLTTKVSELPEFLAKNRNISASVSKNSNSDDKKSSDFYDADGTIITGHIPTWRTLSQADCNKVFAERERLGIGKRKSSSKSTTPAN